MFFRERGARPHRVVYEDLVSDQLHAIAGILDYLELSAPCGFVIPDLPVKKQATSLNDEWADRFKHGEHGWSLP